MCIDFRKLNEITNGDSYLMPLATVIFNKTPGHMYYSKIEICLLPNSNQAGR